MARGKARTTKKKNGGAKPMPSLIYQNIKLEDESPEEQTKTEITIKENNQTTQEDILAAYKRSQTKSKHWMWVGVLSITAIIFFFWGWSIISRITLFDWGHTEEGDLFKKTENDWQQIFSPSDYAPKDNQTIKEKLTNIINDLKKQAEPTNVSSTATSTNLITASTTITTTTINTTTH